MILPCRFIDILMMQPLHRGLTGVGREPVRLISNRKPLRTVKAILPSPASLSVLPCSGTETSPDLDVEEKVKEAFDRGWGVVVWNDPVNLMHYVVHVFQTVLKMELQQATKHMLEVHKQGKSLVAKETREQAEFLVHRLQNYGLKTTMEPV